jgi:DNA-binding transcriptional ArsR family regulator
MTAATALDTRTGRNVPGARDLDPGQMMERASEATAFLKAMAHDGRLTILCLLVTEDRTVTELERLLGARQAAVSQQLARLRQEGLVESRREGKNLLYSLADGRVRRMVETLHDLFCP